MRIPRLVAHRGYALRYPENTLSAVSAAIERGAELIEVDVQLSSSRTPFLYHDRTTQRVSGRPGTFMELDDAAIGELRAPEPRRFGERFADEPVARLDELARLLEQHPGPECFVEAKGESIEVFGADAMLDAILAAIAAVVERCILISFDVPVLEAARRRGEPRRLGVVLDHWAQRLDPAVVALAPEWIFCDRRELPRRGPLDTDLGGAALAVYEVVEPREALDLAARGAHAVETFELGELADGMARLARGAAP